jgi:DNA-binding MarR family transcriptional regulator
MGELVDDLVARGYLERREDPDDRRAKRIYLTHKGRANAVASRAAVAAIEAQLEAQLGTRQYQQLRRLLERIVRGDPR